MNSLLSSFKTEIKNSRFVVLLFVVLVFLCSNKAAAALAEVQPLSFGTFAIVNNLTVSTLAVPYSGSNPVPSIKIYPLVRAQPGHYQITGLPAFQPLTITINNFVLSVGGAEPFNVNTFTFPALITDTNGEALLKVGATLNTTGSGTEYADATYTGSINITVSF